MWKWRGWVLFRNLFKDGQSFFVFSAACIKFISWDIFCGGENFKSLFVTEIFSVDQLVKFIHRNVFAHANILVILVEFVVVSDITVNVLASMSVIAFTFQEILLAWFSLITVVQMGFQSELLFSVSVATLVAVSAPASE